MIVLLTLAAIAAMSAAADQSMRVSVQARAIQPGELVVLTVTSDEPVAAIRASAFDRVLPSYGVDATTWRVLAAIDLDVKPGRHTVSIDADGATAGRVTHTLAVTPKQFRTRTLTVNPAFVNPPESARERIREESALLAKVFASLAPERLWRGPFVRPVPQQANSAFGTRSVFNGEPRSAHTGADFLSPAGTPVKAPNAGRVVLARDLYYSGRTVIIDHGLGVASHLAHLSAIDVVEGAAVEAGDLVGKVGATGRVTGAHLHWSVRVGPARVDPLSLLEVMGAMQSGHRQSAIHRDIRASGSPLTGRESAVPQSPTGTSTRRAASAARTVSGVPGSGRDWRATAGARPAEQHQPFRTPVVDGAVHPDERERIQYDDTRRGRARRGGVWRGAPG